MKDSQINSETDIQDYENSLDLSDNLYPTEENKSSDKEVVTSYLYIKSNSSLSAILNICASTFGAGCLTFPHFVDSIGIMNSFFIYIFVSICLYFSFDLLRRFVVDTEYYSFSVMTERVLNKKWLLVYALSSSIFYLSGIISYMNVCYSILRTVFNNEETYLKYIYGILYILITYAVEILLCIYTRNTKRVHLISIIVIISFSIFVLFIIIGGIKGCNSEKFSSEKFFSPFDNKSSTEIFFEFIYTAIMYIYGFSYHSTFPTFLGNVKTIAKSSKMINIVSFGIVCLSYLIISFFGYLYKNEVPEQLFLDRINEDNNFLNIFLKIVAFIFLFSLIPHRYITIRDGYKCLLGNDKFNDKIDLIFIIICLFIANIIVFLDQEIIRGENSNYNIFSVFTNIFGGLLGVIIAFLLPVINFAAINGKTRKRAIVGYIISAIFIIVGIISVIYSFYKIDHSENKN